MMKPYGLFFLPALILFSCIGNKKDTIDAQISDTPNSGKISISVDASFLPLLNDEVTIFEKETPNAKIELVMLSESKGIQDFLDKKNRAIITTRKLSNDEIKFGKQNDLNPLHFFIAFDAVLLIINKENPDSVFTSNEIREVIEGNSTKEISVVFNSNGSGEIQFFKNLYNLNKLPSNFFATNNLTELIKYILTHKSAIGVIGLSNMLYNTDSLTEKVKIVSIRNSNGNKYLPTETNIRSGYYPFRREVYIVCGESWPGLGTGFAKFMTTDIGQTIIKRAGLIPARLSLRMIEVKKDF